jgi:pimeloyl-ACP methyl ester carboxylesterase
MKCLGSPFSRPGLWRWLCLAALLGGIAFALQCVAYVEWHQDWQLFPGRRTQGQPDRIMPPSTEYELVHFTSASGDAIVALFGNALDADLHPRADATSRPTILFFCGNNSSMTDFLPEFAGWRRLGFNFMIPDYPGYGMSGGSASEHACYACAYAAYDYLCKRHDVDSAKIVAAGWSLGAAVATDLAVHRPVQGLAVMSIFTKWNAFEEHDWWLPARLFLQADFDNEAKFAQLRCPVFIAHGLHDQFIPFAHAQRLASLRSGVVPMAIHSGHDIWGAHRDEVLRAVGQFVEKCCAGER